ncbi:MMPL family transporter [Speluncibacter jeojiensis]|uniref:MMPL family transporter n=1 Tax=Speluncibacter jeojiensis TaxID=2710754 RepID=UPI00240F9144|nr:MMPL family transporter [Rhodococcus sp. D2-41]
MTSLLTRLAAAVTRHPRVVLAGALVIAALAVVFGASASSHLKAGGFTAADAESTRASQLLAERFHGGEPNLVLLVTTDHGVDTGAARAAGDRVAAELSHEPHVGAVESYWSAPPDVAPALRSKDSMSAIITARVAGDDTDAPDRAGVIADRLTGSRDGITVRAGGFAAVEHEINDRITADLAVAEAIALPLTALLLIWVFGSVVAALLPLAIGVFSIVSTLALLRTLTLVTDVSVYALNMTTALGLALAIDYSLFIVSRFREELGRGLDPVPAVLRTVQTAGRTVLFSALTVALSLAALVVFPQYFLKSFAYAGLAVVATASLASILILPAALTLMGRRVDALDVRELLRRRLGRPPRSPVEPERTLWFRLVTSVMRHAAPVAVVVIALLLALGAPFLSVRFGAADDRVITDGSASRQVGDVLRSDYAQNATSTVVAVLPDFRGGPGSLGDYAVGLSDVDGVGAVRSSAGTFVSGLRIGSAAPGTRDGSSTFLTIESDVDPFSATGADQLADLRAVPSPAPVLFTGAAAQNEDATAALEAKLPLALALIALATFLVLYWFTGSVVLPLKALVINALSLSAAFGAMVWAFQYGHLGGLLGFTPTGFLIPSIPILMFCIAFGMSMDYEVFLLSRIRGEWMRSGRGTADNSRAVALGVARTGRIITAAAALMAVVFFSMVASQVSFIQLFGLGLTITVLADATLIRGVLVPALMQLMGRFNWWAPRWMTALHSPAGAHDRPRQTPSTLHRLGRRRPRR